MSLTIHSSSWCLFVSATLVQSSLAFDFWDPVEHVAASHDAIRLPCDTGRHVHPGEKLALDSTAFLHRSPRSTGRKSEREMPVSMQLGIPEPLLTSQGDGYASPKVPRVPRYFGSNGGAHYIMNWRNPPEICRWTFTSDTTCQLAMHMVFYRRGDPHCSKQYLLLEDGLKEIQVCGSSIPPYIFKSETQKLNIKFFRRPNTHKTMFKGYVECHDKNSSHPYVKDYDYYNGGGEYKIDNNSLVHHYQNGKLENLTYLTYLEKYKKSTTTTFAPTTIPSDPLPLSNATKYSTEQNTTVSTDPSDFDDDLYTSTTYSLALDEANYTTQFPSSKLPNNFSVHPLEYPSSNVTAYHNSANNHNYNDSVDSLNGTKSFSNYESKVSSLPVQYQPNVIAEKVGTKYLLPTIDVFPSPSNRTTGSSINHKEQYSQESYENFPLISNMTSPGDETTKTYKEHEDSTATTYSSEVYSINPTNVSMERKPNVFYNTSSTTPTGTDYTQNLTASDSDHPNGGSDETYYGAHTPLYNRTENYTIVSPHYNESRIYNSYSNNNSTLGNYSTNTTSSPYYGYSEEKEKSYVGRSSKVNEGLRRPSIMLKNPNAPENAALNSPFQSLMKSVLHVPRSQADQQSVYYSNVGIPHFKTNYSTSHSVRSQRNVSKVVSWASFKTKN